MDAFSFQKKNNDDDDDKDVVSAVTCEKAFVVENETSLITNTGQILVMLGS